jgi:hypothetical protein
MTRDEALALLDDLDNQPREVSEWEANFLDSLMKQSERNPTWRPTDKQAATLERMRERYL